MQPILAAVPDHCNLNLPWKCTGILQNLSLKPHPPPSQCSSSFPHAATSPSSTHPAVPAHTQAEGVLVGAAGAVVYHAFHGHHFPSFLGLAVQVASLLGCKGSGGLIAGCSCQDFRPSSVGRAQCRGPGQRDPFLPWSLWSYLSGQWQCYAVSNLSSQAQEHPSWGGAA